MKRASLRRFGVPFLAGLASLALAAGLRAQGAAQAPAPTGPMATEKYKDIEVLNDVPADQLELTMRYFVAATGIQCAGCHFRDTTTNELVFEHDSRGKSTARQMINIVKTVNAGNFGVRINCGTCHQGHNQPAGLQPAQMMTDAEIATMTAQLAAEAARQGGPGAARGAAPARGATPPQGGQPGGRGNQPPAPAVDDLVAKYVNALGGDAAIAKITSRVMTGTVTNRMKQTLAFTIDEKGDKFHETVAATPAPMAIGFDGTSGWTHNGSTTSDLTGFPLDQALRMADLGLAIHLKDRFTTVTSGRSTRLPSTTPGTPGPSVDVITLQTPAKYLTETLYLDATSGLLLRRRIITRTGMNGSLVEQFEYSDYRAVDGVKMPFRITHSNWNSFDTFKVTAIKPNASIADATFFKPAR